MAEYEIAHLVQVACTGHLYQMCYPCCCMALEPIAKTDPGLTGRKELL